MTPRQRERYEEQCPDALEHFDEMENAGPRPEYVNDFDRVSGHTKCETCDTPLFNHPRHPFDSFLTINCDGRLFKL